MEERPGVLWKDGMLERGEAFVVREGSNSVLEDNFGVQYNCSSFSGPPNTSRNEGRCFWSCPEVLMAQPADLIILEFWYPGRFWGQIPHGFSGLTCKCKLDLTIEDHTKHNVGDLESNLSASFLFA